MNVGIISNGRVLMGEYFIGHSYFVEAGINSKFLYINTPVDPMRPYVPAPYFPDAPVCARSG